MKKYLLVIMTAAVVLCTPTSRERYYLQLGGASKGEIINKPVIQETLEMGKRYKNSST